MEELRTQVRELRSIIETMKDQQVSVCSPFSYHLLGCFLQVKDEFCQPGSQPPWG